MWLHWNVIAFLRFHPTEQRGCRLFEDGTRYLIMLQKGILLNLVKMVMSIGEAFPYLSPSSKSTGVLLSAVF